MLFGREFSRKQVCVAGAGILCAALLIGGGAYAISHASWTGDSNAPAVSQSKDDEKQDMVLTLEVKADGWDADTSTPIIAHIEDADGEVDFYTAIAANKQVTVEIGESGTYSVTLIPPVNADGSMTILILTEEGELIAARDSMGRLPVLIGQREDGYCVSFESFAYHKLDYQDAYELGPREIVRLNAKGFQTLSPAGKQMRICAFLWTYYGYPNSNYEGVNVELMRYRNGAIMARDEAERGGVPEVDFVAGVPDSGVPHAMGYANHSGKPLARPFVKYTPTWPRSFMPEDQQVRSRVARMKQIPVPELIEGKKLLFVDDSIVRGTQLRETVDFLYSTGAAEVHMRSACPPIMYPCRYLNFSRGNSAMELLARRMVQELEGNEGQKHLEEYADSRTERGKCLLHEICAQFGFDSLSYQSLGGLLEAIGLDRDKVCTYCWTGKE